MSFEEIDEEFAETNPSLALSKTATLAGTVGADKDRG